MTRARLPLAPLAAALGAVLALAACAPSAVVTPPTTTPAPAASAETVAGVSASDLLFLDTLQARTFDWFWETTDAETGLVPDRWPTKNFSSVAAIGFGLAAYGVGAERGYVTREQAAERTLTTLRFLYDAPQGTDQRGTTGYKGYFYHFLNDDGSRYRDVELSSIDTALLMGGVLFAQGYFDRDGRDETDIRAYADSLYQRVEWDFFQVQGPLQTMAWRPEVGYGKAEYQGYNEAMLLYVLALGSPTFPADGEVWDRYTSTYIWGDYYGQEHLNFSPLFGHQYSQTFIDFRGVQDAFMRGKSAETGTPVDYFENSRRATYAQRAYAIDNPAGWVDYSDAIWGLTACDGPGGVRRVYNGEERQFRGYSARGVSLEYVNDDGTIAPTAAGGSMAFAPEIAVPALRAMRARYGSDLFTEYGFRDAFNPSFTFADAQIKQNSEVTDQGWFDHDYLGIDQGPILLMAENLRTGLVWDVLRRNPAVIRGLRRAGFQGGWLSEAASAPRPVVIRDRQMEPTADARPTVVILGSSTAEGVGPTAEDSTWVNRLRADLGPGVRVVNLARGGYTTYQLLPTDAQLAEATEQETGAERPAPDEARNVTAALERRPVAVVLNLASNDSAYGYTLEEQQRGYAAILDAVRDAGVPVWVTTTQPRDLDPAGRATQVAMRDWLRETYGAGAIDFWTGVATPADGLDPRWDSGDGVHLNDAAHGVLYERVRDAGVPDRIRATLD